jgi:protein SCO1
MVVRTLGIALAALALLAAGTAQADPNLPPILREVGFDQRLNEQVPLDLELRDETGRTVRLADYFDGKPVVLVLAYYRCPMLCTQVLNGLTKALIDLPLSAGREFNVLTVSFDAREKPELAAAKRRAYLDHYARPGAERGWHFLTGDEEPIKRLTQAVGFRYTYDPRHDVFAHASGIMVLTPAGRVSRYFLDIKYSPRDLRLGLVEASEGRIGTPWDKALLFCFHYDPREGKYGPAVMNLVRAGGVLTVLGLALFAGLLWRRERVKARQNRAEAT